MVYPTLTYLEEAGYVRAASEGSRKVYAITEHGRSHLAANRDIADTILAGMARYGERMARARVWFYRYEDGSTDLPGVIAEVNEARRALKRSDRRPARRARGRAAAHGPHPQPGGGRDPPIPDNSSDEPSRDEPTAQSARPPV